MSPLHQTKSTAKQHQNSSRKKRLNTKRLRLIRANWSQKGGPRYKKRL